MSLLHITTSSAVSVVINHKISHPFTPEVISTSCFSTARSQKEVTISGAQLRSNRTRRWHDLNPQIETCICELTPPSSLLLFCYSPSLESLGPSVATWICLRVSSRCLSRGGSLHVDHEDEIWICLDGSKNANKERVRTILHTCMPRTLLGNNVVHRWKGCT